MPRAERAPAQLGDAVAAPPAVPRARVRRAVARHHEGLAAAAEEAAAEQQARAEGARCQVQAGDGVLAQLLARRRRALVRLAVLQRRESALVAAAAQLARVVLAVGLAGFEAVDTTDAAEVGSRALRLVVCGPRCQLAAVPTMTRAGPGVSRVSHAGYKISPSGPLSM